MFAKCNACDGHGYIGWLRNRCTECFGAGVVFVSGNPSPAPSPDYRAEALAWRRMDFWGHVSPGDLGPAHGHVTREQISDRHREADRELEAIRAANERAEKGGA